MDYVFLNDIILEDEWEYWLPIEEFPGYFVSNYGRVYSERTNRVLKPSLSDGRPFVVLRRDGKSYTRTIHRLEAIAFLGYRNLEFDVNHDDGVKSNNLIENLEWATRSQNIKHSYDILGRAPVNEVPVLLVEEKLVFPNQTECAKYLDVHPSMVSLAVRRGVRCKGLTIERVT